MSLLYVYHVNEVKYKNLKTWKRKTANQRCRNKRFFIEKVLNLSKNELRNAFLTCFSLLKCVGFRTLMGNKKLDVLTKRTFSKNVPSVRTFQMFWIGCWEHSKCFRTFWKCTDNQNKISKCTDKKNILLKSSAEKYKKKVLFYGTLPCSWRLIETFPMFQKMFCMYFFDG